MVPDLFCLQVCCLLFDHLNRYMKKGNITRCKRHIDWEHLVKGTLDWELLVKGTFQLRNLLVYNNLMQLICVQFGYSTMFNLLFVMTLLCSCVRPLPRQGSESIEPTAFTPGVPQGLGGSQSTRCHQRCHWPLASIDQMEHPISQVE